MVVTPDQIMTEKQIVMHKIELQPIEVKSNISTQHEGKNGSDTVERNMVNKKGSHNLVRSIVAPPEDFSPHSRYSQRSINESIKIIASSENSIKNGNKQSVHETDCNPPVECRSNTCDPVIQPVPSCNSVHDDRIQPNKSLHIIRSKNLTHSIVSLNVDHQRSQISQISKKEGSKDDQWNIKRCERARKILWKIEYCNRNIDSIKKDIRLENQGTLCMNLNNSNNVMRRKKISAEHKKIRRYLNDLACNELRWCYPDTILIATTLSEECMLSKGEDDFGIPISQSNQTVQPVQTTDRSNIYAKLEEYVKDMKRIEQSYLAALQHLLPPNQGDQEPGFRNNCNCGCHDQNSRQANNSYSREKGGVVVGYNSERDESPLSIPTINYSQNPNYREPYTRNVNEQHVNNNYNNVPYEKRGQFNLNSSARHYNRNLLHDDSDGGAKENFFNNRPYRMGESTLGSSTKNYNDNQKFGEPDYGRVNEKYFNRRYSNRPSTQRIYAGGGSNNPSFNNSQNNLYKKPQSGVDYNKTEATVTKLKTSTVVTEESNKCPKCPICKPCLPAPCCFPFYNDCFPYPIESPTRLEPRTLPTCLQSIRRCHCSAFDPTGTDLSFRSNRM